MTERIARGDFVYRDGPPIVFAASQGTTLTDAEGRRYVDAEAANGAAVLGYDCELVQAAIRRCSDLPSLPSFCESEPRLELARRLAARFEAATGTRGRVAFELGGAQGIELALKIAAKHRAAGTTLVFEGAYHGRSGATSLLSASARYRLPGLTPAATQILRLPYPDCARCRFGREAATCDAECAQFARRSIGEEVGGVNDGASAGVRAFVFEPLLNAGGFVAPDPRYVEEVVRTVRAGGGLVIADEVFTGMGRLGTFWGFQRFGIVPDIIVASKALTNGAVPLSAVFARDPLLSDDSFPPGTHSTTFGNYALGLAVAASVLDRFDRHADFVPETVALEARLRGVVDRLSRDCPGVVGTDVYGCVARLRLAGPRAAAVRGRALRAGYDAPHCGYAGVLVASTAMAPDVVGLHPAYLIDEEALGATETLVASAITAEFA